MFLPLDLLPPGVVAILETFWEFVKIWWWAPLPFVLWPAFIHFWKWMRNEMWLTTVFSPVILEIKLPKEVVKPIRAMESVMASIHGATYQPPDWWETWIEGQLQVSVVFEIVSLGGEIHFLVRFWKTYRDSIEAAIYSQFPEAELIQVDDYTKYVPHDIPNKDWDLFGFDYRLLKENYYPIKTYKDFETEQEALEEKRIDPVSSLLESMSKIKPGEHLWVQIAASPISEEPAKEFLEEAYAARDLLVRRPEKPKSKSMFQEAADILIYAKPPGAEEVKEEVIPPEMKLTPGERMDVSKIEEKISKPLFSCWARAIYLGEKSVWFKPNFRLAFNFFNSYTNLSLNGLVPYGDTFTKIHKSWFLPVNIIRKRRDYLRKRKMIRNYKERNAPLFPRKTPWPASFILNTEELASLFHFPSWRISPLPGVSRVEARKGAPPELPME